MEQVTLTVVLVTIFVMVATVLRAFVMRMIKQFKVNRALDAFPSPPRHWLYGSRTQDKPRGLCAIHLERTQAFPRGYRVWQGPFSSALLVVHPDLIRPVLKVSDPKARVYTQSLQPWLGEGLLIASGPKWLRDRRLLTPAFHFDVLKSYVEVFNDASEVFMQKLDELIEKKESLRLFENISLLTLDIILQCAFSYQTDCQLPGKKHPYAVNVCELALAWNKRARNVLCALFPPLYWLTADGRKFSDLCDRVHKEADIIIARRRAVLDEQGTQVLEEKKNLDFLDILLTAKDEGGNGMSAADIRAEVDTFLFAGHDTTSTAISWTLYLMAKHPNYQKEVQAEIDDLMTEQGTDRVDKGAFARLQVLTKCLKESMRLFPPVPVIARQLSQDLLVDGHPVPAGTTVNIPLWALHHNPKVWGEDHMEYKPDRFNDENVKKQDPFSFIPFSAGPRNCIGQNFAMNEVKVVLARLLHRYTFSLPKDSKQPSPSVRIVLRPDEEICLNLTPRT